MNARGVPARSTASTSGFAADARDKGDEGDDMVRGRSGKVEAEMADPRSIGQDQLVK